MHPFIIVLLTLLVVVFLMCVYLGVRVCIKGKPWWLLAIVGGYVLFVALMFLLVLMIAVCSTVNLLPSIMDWYLY